MSASRYIREQAGASLVEFLLVLPFVFGLTFAVIDMGLLMWQWNQSAKATQVGARMAATRAPVATGVNVFANPSDTAYVGKSCTNADGSPRQYSDGGTLKNLCPNRYSTCTADFVSGTVACANTSYTANTTSWNLIVSAMQSFQPLIEPKNVRIVYSSVGLGFVGGDFGSPVAVTVSLRCLAMPLIILDWFFTPPAGCPADTDGAPIPAFATTLIGEDLAG